MKKLMMMFAALLVGIAAQAATCTWTLMNIKGPEGTSAQAGWAVYIMDSSTYEVFNGLGADQKASYASENKALQTTVVNSRGFKVNLDVGTMICNDEDCTCLEQDYHLINHVHITPNFGAILFVPIFVCEEELKSGSNNLLGSKNLACVTPKDV